MQNRFSLLLSYILHPMFIPLISVLLVYNIPFLLPATFTYKSKWLILFIVAVFTVIIPLLSSFILLKIKMIDSLTMSKREHRNIPLLIVSSSYLAMLYFMKLLGTPPAVLYILYTALFALLIGLLVNLFYKISLHTLGWGAMASSFAGLMTETGFNMIIIIIGVIAIAGVVGYARLKEKAHSAVQVYSGFLLGFLSILLLTALV